MTLDKLLKISSQEWDTLSDDDLHKILAPYFAVTKPPPTDKAMKALNGKGSSKGSGKTRVSSSASQQLLDLAKQLGMNIPPPK